MSYHLRRVLTGLLLALMAAVCFGLPAPISRAQGVEQDLSVSGSETFTDNAGRTNVIAWPPGNPNPVNRNILKQAVIASLQRYDGLFSGGRMGRIRRVYLYLSAERPGPRGLLAQGGRQTRRVQLSASNVLAPEDLCFVYVRLAPDLGSAATLQFTLAHEIAHCYQSFYVAAAYPVQEPEPDVVKWWTEGTAEWLATLVYPPTDLEVRHASFIDNRGQSLISGLFEYDAMFFWAFLDPYLGTQRTIELLKAIPRNAGSFPAFFRAQRLDKRAFANWGYFLGQSWIPNQPAPQQLFSSVPIDAANLASARLPITTDKFSFTIVPIINLTGLESGKGLKLTFSGINAHGAEVLSDYGRPIQDGQAETYCAQNNYRFFVLGRADQGSDDNGVRVEASLASCTEQTFVPPPEIPNAGDNCYLGTWKLVSWPGSVPDAGVSTNLGKSSFIVEANGNFQLAFDGIVATVQGNVTIRLNGIKYKGKLSAAREAGARFKVTLDSATLEGTPKVTMQVGNGPQQDIGSANLQRQLSQIGGQAGTLRLICRAQGVLEYQVTAAGTAVSYFFAR